MVCFWTSEDLSYPAQKNVGPYNFEVIITEPTNCSFFWLKLCWAHVTVDCRVFWSSVLQSLPHCTWSFRKYYLSGREFAVCSVSGTCIHFSQMSQKWDSNESTSSICLLTAGHFPTCGWWRHTHSRKILRGKHEDWPWLNCLPCGTVNHHTDLNLSQLLLLSWFKHSFLSHGSPSFFISRGVLADWATGSQRTVTLSQTAAILHLFLPL